MNVQNIIRTDELYSDITGSFHDEGIAPHLMLHLLGHNRICTGVHEDIEFTQSFHPIFQSRILNIVQGHCTDFMRAQITGNYGQYL
jgi:hypothetical protein